MDFIARLETEYGIALNPQQKRAVCTVNGAVLLLAVPGSGKTTVLIARLANMLQNHGIRPQQVLTLTFSRRSAADMAQRYARFFGNAATTPSFATIHSFCYGVVNHISAQYRRPLPRVVAEIGEIVRGLYCQLENARFIEREKLDEIVGAIGFCKNRLADEEEVARVQIEECDFPRLYRAYHAHMAERRLMDYDDMLVFTYDMFRKNPSFLAQYQAAYSHICVDEAQDTSLVQHRIIELLAKKSGNLFMVGDEDQSIYGFRGAFPDALLRFEETWPGGQVLKMEENYRSTSEVVRAANRLIRQNTARIEKQMFTGRGSGKVAVHEVRAPSEQYARVVELLRERMRTAGQTAVVLYRYNETAIPLVDALARAGVPFSLKETRDAFFQAVHIKEMLAFLRLALDPSDLDSFSQIYSKTNAYFSRSVLEFVQRSHKAGESVFRTLSKCPGLESVRLENLRAQILLLGKRKPVDALNLLEEVVSRGYFVSESAQRRLALLKSIAVGQTSVAGLLTRIEELRAIVADAPAWAEGAVALSTLHSSKGLEYGCVLMLDLAEGLFPPKSALDLLAQGERKEYEEEVRLCYVGATRAQDELHLITFAAGNRANRPSRFVRLLTADPPPSQKPPSPARATRAKPSVPLEAPPVGYCRVLEEAQLAPGKRVLHASFGEGRVLHLENGYLSWFDGVVTKKFSVRACLENGNLFLREHGE